MKLIRKTVVFHVGTLNISNKRKFSHETGLGISVSEHPMEWMKIAKIGGNIYKFTNPKGNFLDVYKLTKPDMNRIEKWGIINKLVEKSLIYYFTYYNSEADSTMKMEFTSKQEAINNARLENAKVKTREGLTATQKFHKLVGWKINQLMVKDYLITYFAHTTDVDGVWFNDKLDIANYSAPRGTIFDNKLFRWNIKQVKL